MTLLIDPFPANHYSAFPIGIPFYALSILTIFLDNCHMKRVENINILMKVKLFCSKKNFFGKKLNIIYLKTMFLKKKLLFLKKKLSFKTKKKIFF